MAINPLLKELVSRTRKKQASQLLVALTNHDSTIALIAAELAAAKAEVKMARLELRILRAEHAREQTLFNLNCAEHMQDQEAA